ncbi:MAG: ATP-binding cassette domain-containing protein, partial [Actinobacteria bacterium]|nr:ATP-binding cassette domain-containing protein [Actinomycetota bacterium]
MELTSHQRSPVLEVDALTVAFGTAGRTVKAVDEVSLDVEEGDIYAVVGESGCGKSTLAYSLLDVVPPPGRVVSGEVRFKGRSFHDMNKSELNGLRAAKIAMVFQAAMNARNPVITIGRQVEHIMGAHPAVFGSAREGRAYFEELLGFLRLEPAQIWDSFESQLSGGMRQRVAVAIAMLLKPSVLVLDEPTTALDLLNQRMVVDMLRQLQRSFGVTIILITHDLGVVAEIATRVGVMYAGRLVETGTVEEIFAKGRRHPYVAALIEAIPSVLGTGLFVHSIPGQVPNLADLPSGCRFAPRCPLARDICVEVEPLLFATEDGHAVACHVVNDDVAELKTAPDLNALSAQDGKLDTRVVGYENAADRHRFVHGEILLREPASGQAEVEGAFGSNRPAPVEDVGANGRKGSMRLLEVDGVSHWFPETVAGRSVLDHINLSLDRQDIVAVVGESGCGKTTLGRIIAGLSRPADGEVHFDGRDIWTLKRKEFKAYRRAVQVVQQ